MTIPIYRDYTLQACPDTVLTVNYDLDYFASNVTGATWTLTNTETTDDLGHQVSIKNDTATNHSGKTALITGFFGIYPITETVTLPAGNATVKSTKYFTKITSIVPSATIGTDTMDIGICEIAIIPIIISNWRGNNESLYTYFISGTAIDYTVQVSGSNPEPARNHAPLGSSVYAGLYDSWNWQNHSDLDLVNATGDTLSNTQDPVRMYRWLINSYTASSTPRIKIEILQMNDHNP